MPVTNEMSAKCLFSPISSSNLKDAQFILFIKLRKAE